jgi:hypothetical protein
MVGFALLAVGALAVCVATALWGHYTGMGDEPAVTQDECYKGWLAIATRYGRPPCGHRVGTHYCLVTGQKQDEGRTNPADVHPPPPTPPSPQQQLLLHLGYPRVVNALLPLVAANERPSTCWTYRLRQRHSGLVVQYTEPMTGQTRIHTLETDQAVCLQHLMELSDPVVAHAWCHPDDGVTEEDEHAQRNHVGQIMASGTVNHQPSHYPAPPRE